MLLMLLHAVWLLALLLFSSWSLSSASSPPSSPFPIHSRLALKSPQAQGASEYKQHHLYASFLCFSSFPSFCFFCIVFVFLFLLFCFREEACVRAKVTNAIQCQRKSATLISFEVVGTRFQLKTKTNVVVRVRNSQTQFWIGLPRGERGRGGGGLHNAARSLWGWGLFTSTAHTP